MKVSVKRGSMKPSNVRRSLWSQCWGRRPCSRAAICRDQSCGRTTYGRQCFMYGFAFEPVLLKYTACEPGALRFGVRRFRGELHAAFVSLPVAPSAHEIHGAGAFAQWASTKDAAGRGNRKPPRTSYGIGLSGSWTADSRIRQAYPEWAASPGTRVNACRQIIATRRSRKEPA